MSRLHQYRFTTVIFWLLLLQHLTVAKKKGVNAPVEPAPGYSVPSEMPTAHQEMLAKEYEKFTQKRKKEKELENTPLSELLPKKEGFSPKDKGMKRSTESIFPLTNQVWIEGGTFSFGSQLTMGGKVAPVKAKDGARPRKSAFVKDFALDAHAVTNLQFMDFALSTNYETESELFGWSFVMDSQVSPLIRKEVDGEKGFGRVKDAPHWMAVHNAAWYRPYGMDSHAKEHMDLPVVHVSYKDAVEYCAWAGRRLPTEREWEYAARGGRNGQNYPWGEEFKPGQMNIWEGSEFPRKDLKLDGFSGPAPAVHYTPNAYGLYQMLGNVWEWVSGGKSSSRILRGGSFVDSADGKFNHIVMVSTRQENSGDSAASNIGFRCASSEKPDPALSLTNEKAVAAAHEAAVQAAQDEANARSDSKSIRNKPQQQPQGAFGDTSEHEDTFEDLIEL